MNQMCLILTYALPDFRVKHSAWRAKDRDLMMTIKDYAEEHCSWMWQEFVRNTNRMLSSARM